MDPSSSLRSRAPAPESPESFSIIYRWRRRIGWQLDRLESAPHQLVMAAALAFVALMGVADYFTGPLLSFALFYLLPVSLVAWSVGRRPGLTVAGAAVLAWLAADLMGPISQVTSPVPYWNGAVLLGFLVVVVYLLTTLKAVLSYENHLLAEVQRRLLPESVPAIPGASVAVSWRPAGVVGGDYYDVLPVDEAATALCIADVSGKGVTAALVMSNLQAAVRALVGERIPPSGLCSRLNHLVLDNVRVGTFVTFFFCLLEPELKRLSFCNAGHSPPLLVHGDGTWERLDGGGPVLGVVSKAAYLQRELAVASGDRLILFTDGLTERCGPDDDEFGEARLLAAVIAHRGDNAAGLRDRILEVLDRFGQGPFDDDLTLVVVAVD